MLICNKKCQGYKIDSCVTMMCCCECKCKTDCPSKCISLSKDGDYDCPYIEDRDDEASILEYVAPTLIGEITRLEREKKKIETLEKELKSQLKELMEDYGIANYKNNSITVSYISESERTTIDSTKLKKELPDIAKQYSKVTKVASSITIRVKTKEE